MSKALPPLLPILFGLALAQPAVGTPADAATTPKSDWYIFTEANENSSFLLYEQTSPGNTYLLEAPRSPLQTNWDFLFSRTPDSDETNLASKPELQDAPPTQLLDDSTPAPLPTPPTNLPRVLAPTTAEPYPFPLPEKPALANNPPATNTTPDAPLLDPRLRPGALVPARLVTAAIVPAGMNVPVLVEAKSESCENAACPQLRYLGDARIMVGGRVEIALKYAVVNGQSIPIRASGFAKDDVGYGLKGDVIEQAPSLAADLIRGTLGGISDWTTATLQAQNTTITPSGAVAVDKTAPPLSSFLASRAANLFSLPQDSKALTRVMVVPAGTPLFVYVQDTPSGAAETRR